MKASLSGGRQVAAILVKEFDFEQVRQKGSHVVLRKFVGGQKIVTVVPDHKEVRRGTLKSLLRLAKVPVEEFSVKASKG
ncbi:MAG TPA: type II toxin-antitoxin system HicA family toxin [Candidatus Saccharimonadales bacterium]|nr:type II toxin-antitoxin system HicA family toxin [Candidatus Saccharimonadales bacterium]